MKSASTLSVGDRVNTGTQVGIMGATGNVTGIHLHLELSTTMGWDYDTFLNPSTALGIPNERGTIVKYDGSAPPPEPPEPTPEEKIKRKFPFVLYARKLRKREF